MKTEDRKKLGKKTRKEGKDFEARVRVNLTEKGWTVCRFDNDVRDGKLVQAKTSWRRTPHGMFPLNLSPGFPDFQCHRISVKIDNGGTRIVAPCIPSFNKDNFDYQIIGVECKISGTLDKLEKQKCQWLLDNHIFSKILIASKHKIKNRIHIKYKKWT